MNKLVSIRGVCPPNGTAVLKWTQNEMLAVQRTLSIFLVEKKRYVVAIALHYYGGPNYYDLSYT